MKTLLLALAVSVAATGPAYAQRDQNDQVRLKVRPGDEAKPRQQRLYCGRHEVTGSRIPANVCKTLAEWQVAEVAPRNRNAD